MFGNSNAKQQLADAREDRWKAGKIAATGRTAEERQQASAKHRELGELVTKLRGEVGDDTATLR